MDPQRAFINSDRSRRRPRRHSDPDPARDAVLLVNSQSAKDLAPDQNEILIRVPLEITKFFRSIGQRSDFVLVSSEESLLNEKRRELLYQIHQFCPVYLYLLDTTTDQLRSLINPALGKWKISAFRVENHQVFITCLILQGLNCVWFTAVPSVHFMSFANEYSEKHANITLSEPRRLRAVPRPLPPFITCVSATNPLRAATVKGLLPPP